MVRDTPAQALLTPLQWARGEWPQGAALVAGDPMDRRHVRGAMRAAVRVGLS